MESSSSQRRTYWIIVEQDDQGRYSPICNVLHKNITRWWYTLEEALAWYKKFDEEYWARHEAENPGSPLNQFNRPWKTYFLHVRNIPHGKWLNRNFLDKHVLETKEVVLDKIQPNATQSEPDGYSDGYEDPDGYGDKRFLF